MVLGVSIRAAPVCLRNHLRLDLSEARRRGRGCDNANSRAITEGPGLRGLSSRVKRMLLADERERSKV